MKIYFDLHTHTIASGHAYSTLIENVKEASEKKLIAYGFSDHAEKMFGAPKSIYFKNFKVIPRKLNDVYILRGIEANILDEEGNTDADKLVKFVDYIIASLHLNTGDVKMNSIESSTKAVLNAMKNPNIKIIGHPDDSRFPLDYEKIVKCAVETNTILEVNNSSLTPGNTRVGAYDNYLKLLDLCKKYRAKIILGTDSHFANSVGDFSMCFKLLKEVDFPIELIVNASIDGLNDVLNVNLDLGSL